MERLRREDSLIDRDCRFKENYTDRLVDYLARMGKRKKETKNRGNVGKRKMGRV